MKSKFPSILMLFIAVVPMTTYSQTRTLDNRGKVVRYHTKMDAANYLYGVAPPVARLDPGEILETNTPDALGNAIQKPGDTLRLVRQFNPLAGPFYLENAEPGDTLVVRILAGCGKSQIFATK